MAISKSLMPVSFNLGINTKVDSKQLQGGLLELENMYQSRTGELRMRNGYDELVAETIDGSSITQAVGAATFNDELLLFSPSRIYSYAPQIERWSDKNTLIFTDVSSTSVVSNSTEQTSLDVAQIRGTAVYAWEDSQGGVWANVKDLDSGAILIRDVQLSVNGIRPRCFALGVYLFVFYYDVITEDLKVRRVAVTTPTAFDTEAIIANDIDTVTPYFDVCLLGSSRMVVAYLNNASELAISYVSQNSTVIASTTEPTIDPDMCLTVYPGVQTNNSATYHVAWCNSVTGIGHAAYYDGGQVLLSEIVVDGYSIDARNITGISYDTASDIYWEIPSVEPIDHYVSASWVDTTTNTSATAQVLQRAAGLASKAYKGQTDSESSSVIVSYQSPDRLQNTYFAVGNQMFIDSEVYQGIIEAKILPQAAGGHTVNDSCLPSVWTFENSYIFPSNKQTRTIVGNSSSFSLLSFYQTTLNYTSPPQRVSLPTQLGENLYIPGGYVQAYDGVSAIEQNYHLYPEQPFIEDGYSPGSIADGTYLYVVQWEWIDAEGQRFLSTTSIPTSFEITGGPKSVDLTISALRYTAKTEPLRTPVIISVYRTEDGGDIFYKVSDDTNPLYNDVTQDYISFTDDITDAALVSRPLLNTTGGVLDNTPAPAAAVIRAAKNRVFAAGLENPNQIAFSKEFVPGDSVAFAAEFTLQVDARGGRITALAEMDEKVVIFKESSIFYLTGEGPNDTGTAGEFTITPVATDVGTVEPESVVLTPDGLMFKSSKGIYLLDRGLVPSYIGDRVQQFNDLNVTSAVVVTDLNQVRFTTSAGTTMVYDWYYKLWSTFTNQAASAAVNWQNSYVFAHSDGRVWQENLESFADNGVPIIPKVGTQWFSWAQVQGFQRVQRAQILGDYLGDHRLKVSVYYDFKDSPDLVYYYDMTENLYGTTYGSQSPYGEGVYGTLEGIYQFQIDFDQQKCQSLRLVIEGVFPESTGTPAFTLSALAFLVGVKQGLNRLSPTKQMTSS